MQCNNELTTILPTKPVTNALMFGIGVASTRVREVENNIAKCISNSITDSLGAKKKIFELAKKT